MQDGGHDRNVAVEPPHQDPVDIDANERVNMACTWNNSTSNPDLIINPPQDIGWGERTDQEMCYGFALVSSPLLGKIEDQAR